MQYGQHPSKKNPHLKIQTTAKENYSNHKRETKLTKAESVEPFHLLHWALATGDQVNDHICTPLRVLSVWGVSRFSRGILEMILASGSFVHCKSLDFSSYCSNHAMYSTQALYASSMSSDNQQRQDALKALTAPAVFSKQDLFGSGNSYILSANDDLQSLDSDGEEDSGRALRLKGEVTAFCL